MNFDDFKLAVKNFLDRIPADENPVAVDNPDTPGSRRSRLRSTMTTLFSGYALYLILLTTAAPSLLEQKLYAVPSILTFSNAPLLAFIFYAMYESCYILGDMIMTK